MAWCWIYATESKPHNVSNNITSKMSKFLVFISLIFSSLTSFGQYPFEKYPSPSYSTFNNWNNIEKDTEIEETLSIPKFYKNGDTLTIKITSQDTLETSYIRLYRSNKLFQTFTESTTFSLADSYNKIYVADINGDNLLDLKFYSPQPGNGIAFMNNDVIYLFQNKDENFTKISFIDMFDYGIDSFKYRAERDFDGDHNYEIITMYLVFYDNHSYWKYDLYNYIDGKLINVSLKHKYPIMIQYLFRLNFKVTNKITQKKMQTFVDELPSGYDKE
jgi:hypothetical protein